MKLSYVPLLALALLMNPNLLAQQKRGKKKAVSVKESVAKQSLPIYQEEAFDPAAHVTALPPHYEGIGSEKLTSALKSISLSAKKDQYETTAQFESRLAAEQARPLMGNIRKSDTLALSVETGRDERSRSYDADKGELTIRLTTGILGDVSEPKDFALPRGTQIILISEKSRSKDAVFSNGFGASREGQSFHDEDINALMPWFIPTTFTIKLPPEEARNTKGEPIAVLLIGHLLDDRLIESSFHSKATMDDPIESSVSVQAFKYCPQEAWIYRVADGRILGRVSIQTSSLAKMGISLSRETVFDTNSSSLTKVLSILAPGEFRPVFNEHSSTESDRLNNVWNSVSSGGGPIRLMVTLQTSDHDLLSGETSWDLPKFISDYQAGMEKGYHAQFSEIHIEPVTVDGSFGRSFKAFMKQGSKSYRIAMVALLKNRLYGGQHYLVVVTTIFDASIGDADTESNRIIQSLSARELPPE